MASSSSTTYSSSSLVNENLMSSLGKRKLDVNEISSWSVNTVCSWLTEIGMDDYIPLFHKEKIDGDILLELTDEYLQDIGVKIGFHRMKFLKKLSNITSTPVMENTISTTVTEIPVCPASTSSSVNSMENISSTSAIVATTSSVANTAPISTLAHTVPVATVAGTPHIATNTIATTVPIATTVDNTNTSVIVRANGSTANTAIILSPAAPNHHLIPLSPLPLPPLEPPNQPENHIFINHKALKQRGWYFFKDIEAIERIYISGKLTTEGKKFSSKSWRKEKKLNPNNMIENIDYFDGWENAKNGFDSIYKHENTYKIMPIKGKHIEILPVSRLDITDKSYEYYSF